MLHLVTTYVVGAFAGRRLPTTVLALALAAAGCAHSPQRSRIAYPPAPPRANGQAATDPEPTALAELTASSGVADYVRYALANNPGVEAAFQDYVASLERVPQVTALPDPRFSYRYYLEEVETRVGPQEHAFGITQAFPWFGKLRLHGEAASSAADAALQRFEAARDAVVVEVIDAYLEYYHLGRATRIVRANRDLVQYLERVVRTRYGAGSAGHPDVIRAQVELGTLENQLANLEDSALPLRARLNAALDRPASAPIPFPAEARIVPLGASDDEVLTWIGAGNPELQAWRHTIESAQADTERVVKDAYPDFTLGLDYIATGQARSPGVRGSGDDAIMAGVSFNLPVRREKIRAAEREARARHRSALLRYDDLSNRFQAQGATALFRLRDAERQIGLYRDALLPKARESLNATQSAYSAGSATFTDLIDSQRVLLAFELSYERALANHGQWRAQLERLAGRTFPSPEVPSEGAVR